MSSSPSALGSEHRGRLTSYLVKGYSILKKSLCKEFFLKKSGIIMSKIQKTLGGEDLNENKNIFIDSFICRMLGGRL